MDRESKTRSTAIRIQYVCDDCVGHGYVPVSDREVNACPKCEGTGLTSQPVARTLTQLIKNMLKEYIIYHL